MFQTDQHHNKTWGNPAPSSQNDDGLLIASIIIFLVALVGFFIGLVFSHVLAGVMVLVMIVAGFIFSMEKDG